MESEISERQSNETHNGDQLTNGNVVAVEVAEPEPSSTKNDLKFRDSFYRMLISQLFYDGHQNVAISLSGIVQASRPCPPSNKLFNLVRTTCEKMEKEQEKTSDEHSLANKSTTNGFNPLGASSSNDSNDSASACIDFDYESDKQPISPDAFQYETCYVTSHKAPCRAAAFDRQGIVIATGSLDASIKILDIDR